MTLFLRFFFMRYWKSTTVITFLLVMLLYLTLNLHLYAAMPDVNVSIDLSSPIGTSQFLPGITHADNTLNYPWGDNDLNAVNHVKSLIRNAIPYENTHIMAWGVSDPWPDPSQPEPNDWSVLDSRLQLVIDTNGIPVLTLNEAPWWMKGQLQANGTTRL